MSMLSEALKSIGGAAKKVDYAKVRKDVIPGIASILLPGFGQAYAQGIENQRAEATRNRQLDIQKLQEERLTSQFQASLLQNQKELAETARYHNFLIDKETTDTFNMVSDNARQLFSDAITQLEKKKNTVGLTPEEGFIYQKLPEQFMRFAEQQPRLLEEYKATGKLPMIQLPTATGPEFEASPYSKITLPESVGAPGSLEALAGEVKRTGAMYQAGLLGKDAYDDAVDNYKAAVTENRIGAKEDLQTQIELRRLELAEIANNIQISKLNLELEEMGIKRAELGDKRYVEAANSFENFRKSRIAEARESYKTDSKVKVGEKREAKYKNFNDYLNKTILKGSTFTEMWKKTAAGQLYAKRLPRNYDTFITNTAKEYGFDPNIINAVIKVESNFNPKAVSSAGAKGMMQLMPATATELMVTDPFDASQNIKGGTKYLAQMKKKAGGDIIKALGYYNVGPNADFSKPVNAAARDRYVKKVADRIVVPTAKIIDKEIKAEKSKGTSRAKMIEDARKRGATDAEILYLYSHYGPEKQYTPTRGF